MLTPGIAAVAGTVIAVSAGIRQGWGAALLAEFLMICWATLLYTMGGAAAGPHGRLTSRFRPHPAALTAPPESPPTDWPVPASQFAGNVAAAIWTGAPDAGDAGEWLTENLAEAERRSPGT